MKQEHSSSSSIPLEENLKKALTELLILRLLVDRDYYIGELTTTLNTKSHGVLNIVFPYGAIYRLRQSGYICENEKRNAPDGRRRQYYQITQSGRIYLNQLIAIYTTFTDGVDAVLTEGVIEHD